MEVVVDVVVLVKMVGEEEEMKGREGHGWVKVVECKGKRVSSKVTYREIKTLPVIGSRYRYPLY